MKKQLFIASILSACIFVSSGCNTGKGQGFNLFTVEQDLELGKQVKAEIESDPGKYPLLPEAGNAKIYQYIRGLTKKILDRGQVQHRNTFAWEVKIIDDDNTLNAFCTPGGYIYVYTGLIKFLDSEDQLAGVMAHEIAHAALRHSTRQMTKLYGLDGLRQIITGKADAGTIEQLALGLATLKFSRGHETEADSYSVKYLSPTGMNCAGAAGFFKKMEGSKAPPQFLSTHPNPGNRVEAIESRASEYGCQKPASNTSQYAQIKKLI